MDNQNGTISGWNSSSGTIVMSNKTIGPTSFLSHNSLTTHGPTPPPKHPPSIYSWDGLLALLGLPNPPKYK